ncbi:phage/plasmid primase, P4 family [Porcincola sp. LCP21S3_C12]|uniref:phage/plasmid primase, P4 family n=1 Tax=Porcincola sp. LCP21S3_C12 TaxID=3438798 RepID=UPI003F995E92
MTEMHIFTADCIGDEKNCRYPNAVTVSSEDTLRAAVSKDHVCAQYKNSYRGSSNFIEADCIPMDCDNDHSDDPADWITPEKLANEFSDVDFGITESRHNNMPKDGKSARPRLHIYFRTNKYTDPDVYTALKHTVQEKYPFFDDNALDAGRFIYGSVSKNVVWHEGGKTIEEFLEESDSIDGQTQEIPQGKRNATMSRFAGRVVKRYGCGEEAHRIFMEEAEKCNPPLSDDELSKIWHSAKKWEKKVSSQPGYIPPDKFNQAIPKGPAGSLEPPDYSDIGQAKVLADEYGDVLRFCEQTGFLCYNGINWDISAPAAVGATEEFLDLQLADADLMILKTKQALLDAGVTEELINDRKKAEKDLNGDLLKFLQEYMHALSYRAFVMQRRNMRYVSSAMTAAQPMVHIKFEDLDADPFLLNTPGATYDLRKGMAGRQEHRAEDYLTKVALCDPGDKGKDLWDDMLQKTFLGDQELIDYVQMVMGLAAVGHIFNEALYIAIGGGRNGKSTFFNSIAHVLGNYSGSISADTLTVGVRRNTKWEITELKGKRLAIAAELEEGQRLSTSILKQITSTDPIQGEKKFKDPGEFIPSHTVVLYTNHLPRVGATDDGTWRRLVVIPFHATFSGKSDIKNYGDYLVDHAGPAILAWVIEGAKKVIDAGCHLKRPSVVQNAIDEYRAENDWMTNFMEDCCELGDGLTEKSGDLYDSYRTYCDRIGEFIRNKAEFYAELKNRGITSKRTNKGVLVRGIRVKTDFMDD